MKPLEPQEHDGMPREVATAMLSEPRARLTNTFRKQCKRARETVFVSSSPIRRVSTKEYSLTETIPATLEAKTERRFKSATLRQLIQWLRRAISRRYAVQHKYLSITGDTPKDEAMRIALSMLADRLDIIRDAAEHEIKHRCEK